MNNCNDTNTQKNLFVVDFKSNLNYYSSSIGDFTHPYKFPFKYDRNGPIPTKDRGFYFANTSRLTTSKQPILAPNFICGLVLRVLYPGNIFSVKLGSLEKLLIHANETHIMFSMHVCNSALCSLLTFTDWHNSTWITFYLSISHTSTYMIIQHGEIYYYRAYELIPTSSVTSYSFGGASTGFGGFIYHFYLINGKEGKFNIFANLNNCNETQFFFNKECHECPLANRWPLCSFASGKACYSDNCTMCTGYLYIDCDNCKINSSPPCILSKNCQEGERFNCSKCLSGYTNISLLCVRPPTPDLTNTLTDSFSINFTEYFENNPYFDWGNGVGYANKDESDPLPINSRGYYFNATSFIKSKINVTMNYSFTVSFWIFALNSQPFIDKSSFTLKENAYLAINLSNFGDSRIEYTRKRDKLSLWMSIAFAIDFYDDTTHIYQFTNGNSEEVYSLAGYAFYDEPSDLFIGRSVDNSSYFKGFLYTIQFWQMYVSITYSNFDRLCTNYTTGCLSSCLYGQYYNHWEGYCLPCDSSCKYGCFSLVIRKQVI